MRTALNMAGVSVGSRVVWSGQDDDIPRGTVGEVTGVKENGSILVKFPKGQWAFPGSALQTHASYQVALPITLALLLTLERLTLTQRPNPPPRAPSPPSLVTHHHHHYYTAAS